MSRGQNRDLDLFNCIKKITQFPTNPFSETPFRYLNSHHILVGF